MRAIVILLLLCCPALVHAGKPAFVGKWQLHSVRTKDGPVSNDKLAGGGLTWEFKADGAMQIVVWKGEQSATSSGTWTVEGKTITVVENGTTNKMTFKKVGAKLVLSAVTSSVVMTFVKAKH
jgi:hypothetical protein